MHPIITASLIKARQGDLIRSAEQDRAARQARGTDTDDTRHNHTFPWRVRIVRLAA